MKKKTWKYRTTDPLTVASWVKELGLLHSDLLDELMRLSPYPRQNQPYRGKHWPNNRRKGAGANLNRQSQPKNSAPLSSRCGSPSTSRTSKSSN